MAIGVTGVVTADGETIACDAVVSNCDAVRTYRELLQGTPQSDTIRNAIDTNPRAAVWCLYLGLESPLRTIAASQLCLLARSRR